MTALAVIFVTVRTISRFWVIRNPGIDDCLLILATLVLCGFLGGMGAAIVGNNMGYPTLSLSLSNIITLSKFALVVEVLYYFNICFIKVSIVLTYLRFAVSKTFKRLCYGTAAFHVMLCIASEFAVFFQTSPLSNMWTPQGGFGSSYQVNILVLFYVTAGINIATDFWILCLPIKPLSQIRRPRAEKIALFCIFGAGLFASVASIVRLYAIYIYVSSEDHLRNGLSLLLWCMIEMSVAICCASVTGIRPIWLWLLRRRSRKDLKVDGHKRSRANMNSFFQRKKCEGQGTSDEEAQVHDDLPADSGAAFSNPSGNSDWLSSRGATSTLVTRQGSVHSKVSKESYRGRHSTGEERLNNAVDRETGNVLGQPTPEMKETDQRADENLTKPPIAFKKNIPCSERAPASRFPRRLSDDDYHTFLST
ncbi:hypothetical protein Sste5346_005004 [Sporothrix stenoceras]|uniref:Rhodopsin domain-containing protein n=1 Tax=Sporothrix stenoceras TaxID=5173 RepID=A0ABR3Z5K6_9PEZI